MFNKTNHVGLCAKNRHRISQQGGSEQKPKVVKHYWTTTGHQKASHIIYDKHILRHSCVSKEFGKFFLASVAC